MASKKRKMSKKVNRIRHRQDFFNPGKSNTVDKFFFAHIVQGLALGFGLAISTIVIKGVMEKWDKYTGLVPDSYRQKELYTGISGSSSTK